MARKASKKTDEQSGEPAGKKKRTAKPATVKPKRAVSDKTPVEEIPRPKPARKKRKQSPGVLNLVEKLDQLVLKYTEGQALLDKLAETIREVTGYRAVRIVVTDDRRGWNYKATSGSSAGLWDLQNFTLPGSFKDIFLPGKSRKPVYFTPAGSLHFPRFDDLPDDIPSGLQQLLSSAVEHFGFNSLALIPVRLEDRIIGFMELDAVERGEITVETVEAVEAITDSLQAALGRPGLKDGRPDQRDNLPGQKHGRSAHLKAKDEQLRREVSDRKRAQEEMRMQRDLAVALHGTDDLDEAFALCLGAAIEASGMDSGAIYLVDENTGDLNLVKSRGLSTDFINNVVKFTSDSLQAKIVQDSKPVYARHGELGSAISDLISEEGLQCMTVVPILHENRVIACLNLSSHTIDEIPLYGRNAVESIAAQMGSVLTKIKQKRDLVESERKYSTLVEKARDGVIIILDGLIAYVNDVVCSLTGYTREEIIGMPFTELIEPEMRQQLKDYYDKRMAGGKVPDFWQFKALRKDGEARDAEATTSAITYNARLAGMVVVRDVTERNRASQALAESKERYRALADYNGQLNSIAISFTEASERIELYRVIARSLRSLTDAVAASVSCYDNRLEILKLAYIDMNGVLGDKIADVFGEKLYELEYHIPLEIKNFMLSEKIGHLKDMYETSFGAISREQSDRIMAETGCKSLLALSLNYGSELAGTAIAYLTREHCEVPEEVLKSFAHMAGLALIKKGNDEALKASEERYRRDFYNVSDVIYTLDSDFRVTSISPSVEKLLGYRPDEIEGKEIDELNFIEPESLEKAFSDCLRIFAGEQISASVYHFTGSDGTRKIAEISGAPIVKDGAIIGLVSVARDVTERVNFEQALHDSEEKYRVLAENASVGIIVAQDGIIKFANPHIAEIYQGPIGDIIGKDFRDLLDVDYAEVVYERHLRRIRGEDAPDVYSIKATTRAGGSMWLEIHSVAIEWDGKPATLTFLNDITVRKNTEDALSESEARLYSMLQGSPVPTFVIGNDHEVKYWNSALENLTNVKADEVIGTRNHWKAFYGLERPCLADVLVDGRLDRLNELYAGKYRASALIKDAYEATDFFPEMGDKGKWLRFTAAAIRNEKGFIKGAIETHEDITEQKLADDALREAEAKFRGIIEHSGDFFYMFDLEARPLYLSPQGPTMLGYTAEDFSRMNWTDMLSDNPVNREAIRSTMRAVKTGQKQPAYLMEFIKKDGSHVTVEINESPLKDADGKVIGLVGAIRDVTARYRAESELRESEARFKSIIEHVAEIFYIQNTEREVVYISPQVEQILGYSIDQWMSNYSSLLTDNPMNMQGLEMTDKALKTGEKQSPYILEFKHKDGGTRLAEINESPLKNERGEVIGIVGAAKDITETMRVETALRESEEKFRQFFQNAPVYCYTVDPDGRILDVNNAVMQSLGYTKEQLVGKPVGMLYAPDYQKRAVELLQRWRETGVIGDQEMVVLTSSGERRNVLLSVSAVRDEQGAIISSISVQRDITDRRRAEAALLKSEAKYGTVLEEIDQAYYELDLKGNFTFTNAAAARILGYTHDELIGMNYRAYQPQETLERVREIYGKIYLDQQPRSFETIIVKKDGRQSYHAVTAFPLTDETGKVNGFKGLSRNITESKRVQQELVQSESRYRSLVDTGGAGIATVNLAGEMTFVNDAICQMIGYEREELLGRPFAGFVDPADLPELEKLFLDAVGGNRERPVIEFRLMRKDGGHLWALTNPREMEHEKKLVGFSAIIHDISVLKLTEQSLRESEVKFREMSDMLPQVVFEADVTGRFIYVNKFGYEMFGYTPEDLANGLYMIQTVKHEERKRTLTVYDRILDGRSTSDEFTALRKNGSTFSSIIYTNPVIRENKVVGIRGVVADITVIREAQKALQESEQKYRSVVENAREGILVVQDGQFKYANDALIGFTRYTWEDARKLATDGKFTDVIHPDDRDRVYQNYFKRMSGESSPGQYEFRFIDKDGSVKWLELRATQFTWEGRPATLSFITNVTARKQAEEALRQSEEKYRMLVENTSEYIWTSDMNLKISYVSPAVTSILGYSQEEALEIPVEKGITPASLETVARVFLDGLAADKAGRAAPGRVVTFEAEFIRKDGTTVWAETSVVFVRDASGKTVAIQGVTRDISLRKKAEEALKKSEERYRLLAENALDVIFTTDLGGKITYLSPSVRYLGGYTIEETLQMQTKAPGYDEIFGISMDEIARMRQITQEVLQNPSVARSLEFEFNHRDGFKGWAELKISVARDSDGKTTGVQGVIRDVSAQKKMTEKLIRADRMASLGEMAAGLAHEVNNPLTAVMGFAYLLQQNTTLSAEVKNDVDAIYKEGKRAADVIKNFLLFARGQKLEKQSIYINDIIEGVLRLRQSQMLKENITLTLNLSDDLPAVQGDVSQLQQLFLNLILNAEYFMFRTNRRGNLYIESGQLENRVMVIIKDDGPGVSAEKLGRIFDPFYTTKDVGEGTGLGLSICHGIAREHGGSIRVDSEPGKGATFTVELPAVK